jgi:hypothetical protein
MWVCAGRWPGFTSDIGCYAWSSESVEEMIAALLLPGGALGLSVAVFFGLRLGFRPGTSLEDQ